MKPLTFILIGVLLALIAAGCAQAPPPPTPTADLHDLDLDAFLETSYRQLLLRDPEAVTQLGLAETLGVGNDRLNDISDEFIRETQALEVAILDQLRGYDRASLTPEQQLSVDIYTWYLEDQVRGHPFAHHDYPINPVIFGQQNKLFHFFTDIHPITDRPDVEDYIARLSQVETKWEQLLDGLKLREEAGVVLPRFVIPWVQHDIQGIAHSQPENTPFYTALAEKVDALPDLSPADKEALLDEARREIARSVIPAFKELADTIDHLEKVASDDAGVWKLPNGQAYYAYALRHHTTTSLTADEIHQLGLDEIARIQAEMGAVFAGLGYPADEDLPALFARVARESGSLTGKDIVAGYEAIIQQAQGQLATVFDLRPQAEVVVIGGPIGGFYVEPARDGSRPGAFYAQATGTEFKFGMPTLAYHEAVPGHHLQIALAQELDLPSFRKDTGFTAYAEGWALYAERLAWEMGFYDDDPYGNLGRLQAEAFRAARLVVDTGLHARRWTYDQAVDYMVQNTGLPRSDVEWEVIRYVCWPGQATAYKIGMLKILELRQRAMDQLGDRFDLRQFHNVVLGSGSLPLEILEQVVDSYIDSAQSP